MKGNIMQKSEAIPERPERTQPPPDDPIDELEETIEEAQVVADACAIFRKGRRHGMDPMDALKEARENALW
jgi:hypothetical protein